VLVNAHPRLLGEESYLAGPPRRDLGHRDHVVIKIPWRPGWMGCSSGRSGGN